MAGSAETHRGRSALIALSALVVLGAPFVIMQYPLPDLPSGWCTSGERPGHYTVETVANAALWCQVAAACALVLVLGSIPQGWPGRIAVGILCGLPLALVVGYTMLLYAGRIDCAFS
jgi:hypothetical protein